MYGLRLPIVAVLSVAFSSNMQEALLPRFIEVVNHLNLFYCIDQIHELYDSCVMAVFAYTCM